MSIGPSDQYNTIMNALNTEQHRVVYDTQGKEFKDVTSAEAKKLAKDSRYVTDLPTLKEKVAQFVKENGIDPELETQLEKAFDNRADKLEKRTVWFGGSKRNAAVKNLREIPPEIKKAAQAGQKAISKEVPPSSKGPAKKSPEEMGGVRLPVAGPKEKGKEKAASPPSEEGPSGLPSPAPKPPDIGGMGPPPPKAPDIGGKGPPPPMGGVGGPTFTHKKLTTQADELGKFAGEPDRPQIKEGHDLGKPTKIPEEDRAAYAKEIDAYLFGTPYTVELKRGMSKETVTKREENGLEHTLARIDKELKAHDKDLEELDGIKIQMRAAEEKIGILEKRLREMNEANRKNEPYTLYTVQGGKPSTPITFIPDSEYQAFMNEVEKLEPKEKKLLESKNALPPPEIAIGSQVTRFEGELREQQRGLQELTRSSNELERRIEERHGREENGVPFSQWKGLLAKKAGLKDSWNSILGNMKKGTKATDEVEEIKSDTEVQLEKLQERLPLAKTYQALYLSLQRGDQLMLSMRSPLKVVDQDGK